MSADAPPLRPRGRGVRVLGWTVLGLLVAIGLFVALAFPWGSIDGLRVDAAEVVAPPRPEIKNNDGSSRQGIAVTFSTTNDLQRLREAEGADWIRATLSACEKADVANNVTVSQAYEFDETRLQTFPPTGSGDQRRYRYRVIFEDWLPIPQGASQRLVSAIDIGGGSCFSLNGGWMGQGWLRSDRIPLKLRQPAASTPNGR